jgi:hypothetical protein
MGAAEAGVAGYIAGWGPPSVSPPAAAFARVAVARCGDLRRERAKSLLWAAGRLADYGLRLGLRPEPAVLLHPSVTGRFAAHSPGLAPASRRTLRTNLRFIARRVVPHLDPPGRAAAPRAGQAALHCRADRRVPRTGRRPANRGPQDARRRPGLPGRRRRAGRGRPARRARR